MTATLGDLLISGLDADDRAAFGELVRFLDADDDAQAARELVSRYRRRPEETMRAFAAWLEREAGLGDRFRESVTAAHAVCRKAASLGISDYSLQLADLCPRVFRQPARDLRQNGGDRRSASFQRCEKPLARGSVGYFLGRLERDRPDLLEAYRRGEYRSIRQAAIAAGYVKPPPARRQRTAKR